MDRRAFLKQLAAWSAGAVASVPLFTITEPVWGDERPQPVVAVAKGKDPEDLVARALKSLGGMNAFVKPGQRVVVKPNIGWDRRPEQAANTHPAVVVAVVSAALAAGAKEVLVFDRTCNEERRCYSNSGIRPALEALEDSRVRCEYVDRRKFVPVDIQRGQSLDRWSFYKDALAADAYINVPVAKHHSLARLTIGLKNVMGVIGGRRGVIHQNMGPNLADLNTVVRPVLTVVDATRILLRNGPQGGRLSDVKQTDTVLASADIVAADAVATTLFGLRPEDIPATRAAHAAGLGEMDLARITVRQV